jgi:hypothetical protein
MRPAPRLEAITPDIFERITPAMARDELSAWVESWLVAEHPSHVQSLFVERVEP